MDRETFSDNTEHVYYRKLSDLTSPRAHKVRCDEMPRGCLVAHWSTHPMYVL